MFDIPALVRPASLDEALRALAQCPEAMVISGGTDVLVQNREGRYVGATLVSIHEMPEITGVCLEDDGTLVIGPCTRFTDVTNHPLIQKYIPMLGYAADQVGGPQIRNMGTIGGNICNGATSADTAPSLLALDAVLKLRAADGERIIPLRDFYTGPGKTVRRREEILCEIRIAKTSYERAFGCYIKYGKRAAMEISTLGCAAVVRLTEDARAFESLRLAFGVAAPTPIRLENAERMAAGKEASPETIAELAKGALSELKPRTSWRASKEFRLQLAREMCARAIANAVEQARKGGTL